MEKLAVEGAMVPDSNKREQSKNFWKPYIISILKSPCLSPGGGVPRQINKEWHLHLTEQSVNPSTNYPIPAI